MLKSLCLTEKFLLCLTILLIVLSGCKNNQENTQSETIGNPTPKDFLDDGNADIFVLGDIVYSNVEDVDWVKELNYTIGEKVGEITKQTDKAKDFKNGTSNKLPIGTKIYETDTPIYIAIINDMEIPYLKMIEG
ncbi:hypothetical protein ACTWP4_04815 [Gracilibacillus sp. D59]|uniref:hypothetical protein n=1 Tax=Gracilibacillus sp. D59 TaxID=3457434 RepID=UPI003FCDF475